MSGGPDRRRHSYDDGAYHRGGGGGGRTGHGSRMVPYHTQQQQQQRSRSSYGGMGPRGPRRGGGPPGAGGGGGRYRTGDEPGYIGVPPDDTGTAFIKVSAVSNVRGVAGKIAHSCREAPLESGGTSLPAVLTIGANCVNQAVKAIAVARDYLADDGLDLALQPAFRDENTNRPSVALYLIKEPNRDANGDVDMDEGTSQMNISATSAPSVVAGALAARVRERRAVALTAIGVDAVSNAVLAIGNARLYLEADGLDIRAFPGFVTVDKGGNKLNAMRFRIQVDNI